jgi:hypothetical protein
MLLKIIFEEKILDSHEKSNVRLECNYNQKTMFNILWIKQEFIIMK